MDQKQEIEQVSQLQEEKQKEPDKRSYICGCGKTYLSYPALYTHLKQKHNGVQPEGTIYPNITGQKGKRGRPKIRSDTNKQTEQTNDEPEYCISEMIEFLKSLNIEIQQYQESEIQPLSCVTSFPTGIFEKEEDYLELYEEIRKIVGQPTFNASNISESLQKRDKQEISIYGIFAHILIEIGLKVKEYIYRELCIFGVLYCKALNEIGYQAKSVYNEQIKNAPIEAGNIKKEDTDISNKRFCQAEGADSILLISNEFILEILPVQLKLLDKQNNMELQIFGSSEEKLINAVYVTLHISYWLQSNKLTTNKLALYLDEE